jgi:glycosyltransferase involved in cell wall biosynthesis
VTFWLMTVAEPLPHDPGAPRLLRTGLLARTLASRGHDVTWWSSTFAHEHKTHRASEHQVVDVSPGLTLQLLHSMGYASNISLRRIVNHIGIARQFRKRSERLACPDLVLCSVPTIELAAEAVAYGRRHRVPVVLDIRDLWPDIFVEIVSPPARWVARIALSPFFRSIRRSCSGATAIVGTSAGFVRWALDYGRREKTAADEVFPIGYASDEPAPSAITAARQFWANLGVTDERSVFRVCFVGTMGWHAELNTVIEAARLVSSASAPQRLQLILCGSGPDLANYQQAAAPLGNAVIFPGWIGAPEIWTLLRLSSAGVAAYRDTANLADHVPNKPFEYMSAGLPVLSSIEGSFRQLLEAHACGISYRNGEPRELADAMLRLMRDPSATRRLGENARRLFQADYVADAIYQRMAEHLERLGRE